MLRRPSPSETENDLLNLQKKFFEAKKTVFKENYPPEIINTESKNGDEVVLNITEKQPSCFAFNLDSSAKNEEGFPDTFLLDVQFTQRKLSGKSLFAAALEKGKKKSCYINKNTYDPEEINSTKVKESVFNHETNLCDEAISTSDLDIRESVHKENIATLYRMPENLILEEQKRLLNTLKPNLCKFLKSKARNNINKETKEHVNLSESIEKRSTSALDDSDSDFKRMLENYIDSRWINMDFVEKEKLKWIGDLPDVKALEPNQPYSARFDFNGDLQPFVSPIDVRTSLYHHGDEPERPGYTIQELYQLSRSKVLQQRILALNTLANIIRKTKLGYYDHCFDGQLLQKLLDLDLFFLLRFSLDDNASIPATVFCLHYLLCNDCDEFCLDKFLGVANWDHQPFLSSRTELDSEVENEIKDNILISCDLIKGALRTDLLVRLAYILNKCSPSLETTARIMNCLIRISRHSLEATMKIVNKPVLLKTVWKSITGERPLYESVKLLRVMSSQSSEVAKIISKECSVEYLLLFLEQDENFSLTRKEFYLLKLETLYIWRNFLIQNLLTEKFLSWSPCLTRLLQFYVEKIDVNARTEFDFELFSAMTSLIIVCHKRKISVQPRIKIAMENCLKKWLTQLMAERDCYNFSICKAVGCLFRFFITYFEGFEMTPSDLEFIESVSRKLSAFFKSETYQEMCFALIKSSYILRPSIAEARDPPSLPSLSTVYYGGSKFLTIAQRHSPFPLFISLTRYLMQFYDISSESKALIALFLFSNHLKNYINAFLETLKIAVHKWFMRYETDFLFFVLEMLFIAGDDLALPLAFRLLLSLRVDDKKARQLLLKVFDPSSWKKTEGFPHTSADLYVRKFLRNEVDLRHEGDFVPEEWPYKILALLNNEAEVVDALKFITFLLARHPKALKNITFAARYYYSSYVFLNESIWLDSGVQNFLEMIYGDIVDNKSNFKLVRNKLFGKKSFYDLYTELIIQYAGVSYGLPIFARFILLPLQNNQDVAFRKLLWFEYLHVLRVVTLPFPDDNLALSPFVEPCETDESLLIAYINSVSKGIITKLRNPFVYEIAVSNIKNFMASNSANIKLTAFLQTKISSLKNKQIQCDLINFNADKTTL